MSFCGAGQRQVGYLPLVSTTNRTRRSSVPPGSPLVRPFRLPRRPPYPVRHPSVGGASSSPSLAVQRPCLPCLRLRADLNFEDPSSLEILGAGWVSGRGRYGGGDPFGGPHRWRLAHDASRRGPGRPGREGRRASSDRCSFLLLYAPFLPCPVVQVDTSPFPGRTLPSPSPPKLFLGPGTSTWEPPSMCTGSHVPPGSDPLSWPVRAPSRTCSGRAPCLPS